MKKFITVMALVLSFSANVFADGNYRMFFYPEGEETCRLISIRLIPYKVSLNSYGYKERSPYTRANYHANWDSRKKVFDFLQAPYLPNQEWDIVYTYEKIVNKRGPFGSEKTARMIGKGLVKNIPEGKATFFLPCKERGFFQKTKDRVRHKARELRNRFDNFRRRHFEGLR